MPEMIFTDVAEKSLIADLAFEIGEQEDFQRTARILRCILGYFHRHLSSQGNKALLHALPDYLKAWMNLEEPGPAGGEKQSYQACIREFLEYDKDEDRMDFTGSIDVVITISDRSEEHTSELQ